MTRELVVLGTACQTPTRQRNHNGYLLRFDEHGFLFDPGEGTQRQMLLAGCAAADVTRICVTHFHGDHSLGLGGVLQRISLDDVPHAIHCHYPESGREYFNRLRYSTSYWERAIIVEEPVTGPTAFDCGGVTLSTAALEHRIDCFGYRVTEPAGRSMLPDRLAAVGVSGPDVGRLQREGWLATANGTVTLEETSVPRRGQVFAFIMDTRVCDGATELAQDADLLVCESTYLETDADMAEHYRHLTARQAGRLASEGGVRELVLTHFSQRYPYEEMERFRDEAASEFSGVVHLAEDLMRIPFPSRRLSTSSG